MKQASANLVDQVVIQNWQVKNINYVISGQLLRIGSDNTIQSIETTPAAASINDNDQPIVSLCNAIDFHTTFYNDITLLHYIASH